MKRTIYSALVFLFFIITTGMTIPDDPPRRTSTNVDDVTQPYTAEEWIVSPDEEEEGDQTATKAIECDIRGVISCYDKDYLRIDILLNNSITFKWKTVYAIKLEYDNMNEYYTYYTETKKFIYEKEKNGKIVKTEVLNESGSKDFAGVCDAGDDENSDVYFIIHKTTHIGGTKGNFYYLTSSFFSAYLDTDEKMNIADKTIPVELKFQL